jgi:hypothetical protein
MVSKVDGNLIVPCWVDDDVVKALVDDNGRVTVQIGGTDVTLDINLESSDITLPVEEQSPLTSIQSQLYGWVTNAWHKIAMVRGYSSCARSYLTQTSTGAGWVRAVTGACPANYIRVLEGFSAYHDDVGAITLSAGIYSGGTYYIAKTFQNCARTTWYGDSMDLTCEEGDKFFIGAQVSAAGKTVLGYYLCRQIYIGG